MNPSNFIDCIGKKGGEKRGEKSEDVKGGEIKGRGGREEGEGRVGEEGEGVQNVPVFT